MGRQPKARACGDEDLSRAHILAEGNEAALELLASDAALGGGRLERCLVAAYDAMRERLDAAGKGGEWLDDPAEDALTAATASWPGHRAWEGVEAEDRRPTKRRRTRPDYGFQADWEEYHQPPQVWAGEWTHPGEHTVPVAKASASRR